ncbi:MAG: hypothetical protein EXR27_20165 [Betaproteobacteria bacterium]|nr:hypothetical protein [Betaproteobacteria bacterium]
MAAVAYVTRAVEVRFGAGDLLVVDASDHAIKSGATASAILRAAHGRGAQLFHCPGLHAKMLLLGDAAVIGSANISAASVNQKIEAALITDDQATAAMMRALIEKIASESQEIDDDFLVRIGKIKVSKKVPEISRRTEKTVAPLPAGGSHPRRTKIQPPGASKEARARRKLADRDVVRVLNKHNIRTDNPRVLSFRRKTFVFTGAFDFGTQDKCGQATRALGGRCSPSNHLTSNADVLVVGNLGSANFLWKKYGRKILRANELRQQSRKPLIVSEYRWRKEIDR